MSTADTVDVVVFHSSRREPCSELALVLTAAEIPNRVVAAKGRWMVMVQQRDEASALAELAVYRRENPVSTDQGVSRWAPGMGAIVALVAYVFVMTMLYFASSSPTSGERWESIGQMDAAAVLDGQWWRAITALTLHADIGHLASNLAYGGVFGLMVGRLIGGGLGWLSILIGGMVGNYLNAVIRHSDHFSIGASTAVFAALGILVSHALQPVFHKDRSTLRRWRPLIVGVVMLALTGVGGERTDVGAHVTGFVSGVMIGWAAVRMPTHWLSSKMWQTTFGSFALLTIMIAWVIAARAS